MSIVAPLLLILFWSAVLSFVPITYYLMIKNPPIYRIERAEAQGIFILGNDKNRISRMRVVVIIYGICLSFFTVVYAINRSHQKSGLGPFDVLSTVSVILFVFSILSYLPMAGYLLLKNPWKNKEEGVCLTGAYIFYGLGLFVFSLIFIKSWLLAQNSPFDSNQILSSLLIVVFAAVVLAYLPALLYVYLKIAGPWRKKEIHPNVIFIIYSICFLIFAMIYIVNWVSDEKERIQTSYHSQ